MRTLSISTAAVAEAALGTVEKAAELIDLTKHTGAHPRIGATDVVPFIPIEGVTPEMGWCMSLETNGKPVPFQVAASGGMRWIPLRQKPSKNSVVIGAGALQTGHCAGALRRFRVAR